MADVHIDSFKRGSDTYFRLYIKCPVCNQNGVNVAPDFWVHNKCGGDIYIGDNAYYQCKDCGHSDHIMKWAYYCPTHSGSPDEFVEVTDKSVIADVVAAAGQLVIVAGIPWLQTLLKNL